ncbi:MAG: VapC toxin family PIN domain ribonuclease, partial [Cyanobacteriota bacterium]
MIVVDSSVWIDFFNGVSTPEVERLDGLLGVTPVAIGDLILVEVVQGFRL